MFEWIENVDFKLASFLEFQVSFIVRMNTDFRDQQNAVIAKSRITVTSTCHILSFVSFTIRSAVSVYNLTVYFQSWLECSFVRLFFPFSFLFFLFVHLYNESMYIHVSTSQ